MTGVLGRGALVNWGGVVAAQEADYNMWHSREHMPERLAVPGSRPGRRGVGVEGTADDQKYFMMYEAVDAEVFQRTALTIADNGGGGPFIFGKDVGDWRGIDLDTLHIEAGLPLKQGEPFVARFGEVAKLRATLV